MSAEGTDPPVGDVATELRVLVEVLLDRLEPWLRRAGTQTPRTQTPRTQSPRTQSARTQTPRTPTSGTGADPCSWCPLCALASAVRGDVPGLARELADQGTEVLRSLRTVLDEHAEAGSHVHAPTAPTPDPGLRVQHVTVHRGPAPG